MTTASCITSGRVGTGFTGAVAEDLFRKLEPAARCASSPFAGRLSAEEARQVRYVRPRTGGGDRIPGVDGRWPSAPCLVPRPARGQAGPRDRAGEPELGRQPAEAAAAHGQADPSRPPLLAGRGRHEGRASPTITPRSGATSRRISSAGRSRCCAARTASPARSSSRSTPGRGSIRTSPW